MTAYPTPENAAMAEWDAYPEAKAFLVSVEYVDRDYAVVVTDTVPSHPIWNYCDRTPAGWVYTGDQN